jgi:hemoglobin-like flavoprotein
MNDTRERNLALFNDSYERCIGSSRPPGFLDRFYEIFLGSSEEVAAKFKNTDFHKQVQSLKSSLYYLMMASSGNPEATLHLKRIAELHSRRALDIRPELYDLWLECLLAAVREHDPKFNAETETAWRRVLAYGIDFMKSKY